MTYLKLDVLLLADVFEHFRKICTQYFKLDTASYLTSPGLAWGALLLQTKIELVVINGVDMFSMIDRQKRGRSLLRLLQEAREGKQQIHSGP